MMELQDPGRTSGNKSQWTEEEKLFVQANKDHMTDQEIAAALGRALRSVGDLRRELSGYKQRPWTEEDIDTLRTYWGTTSVQGLCKRLNRSKNAIMVKVFRLGLPRYWDSGDYITVNQLHKAFCGTDFHGAKAESWIKQRNLPVHMKRCGEKSCRVVYLDEFWKWAEQHRAFLDFSKLEPLALGEEPAWVSEQRSKDYRANQICRKDEWTADEDSKLTALLKLHKYGYAELSRILNRSEGAILHRCKTLGLKDRPVAADPHGAGSVWTDDMFAVVADGIRNGERYADIAERIGKSEKALRGKIYYAYLTENADKVRAMLGKGAWGSGAPVPTVKQAISISTYRTSVKSELSILAGVLRYQVNHLGYDPYWQRFMCINWNDMKGCTAGCSDCDTCTEFRRIPPQYCARCGATFYERTENRFCSGCRKARKKNAQRHWRRVNALHR